MTHHSLPLVSLPATGAVSLQLIIERCGFTSRHAETAERHATLLALEPSDAALEQQAGHSAGMHLPW